MPRAPYSFVIAAVLVLAGQSAGQYRFPPETVERKYRADAVNALAFAWLDRVTAESGKPVFLYLHYIEPHPPYTPPEAILDRLLHGRPRPDLGDVSKAMFFAQVAPPDAQMLQQIEDVYDAEVTSLDGMHFCFVPSGP